MNETPQTEKAPSAAFTQFLDAVKSHGVKATILVSKEGEEKRLEYWNLKKGGTDIAPVTEENLVDWRKLTREERRKVFHTPYKYSRRHALNKNKRANV